MNNDSIITNNKFVNAPVDALAFRNLDKITLVSKVAHNTIDILALKMDKNIANLTTDVRELHDTIQESIVSAFKKKYNV